MARKRGRKVHKTVNSITKHNGPNNYNDGPESRVTPSIEVHPSPYHDDETAKTEKKPNKWLEGAWKVIPIAVSIYAVVVSAGSRNAAERSARAAERSAEAALRNADTAERALKTATENFLIDQRAWVNVGRTIHPSEIKAGVSQIDTIGMEFMNNGKTQALDVNTVIAARTLLKDVPFSPLYKGEARDSRTNLRPGVPFNVRVPTVTLRQEQIDAIKNGTLIFYVYGEISYEDIFTNSHCTKFCVSFSPDLKRTGFCGVYNEMVDTECEYTK